MTLLQAARNSWPLMVPLLRCRLPRAGALEALDALEDAGVADAALLAHLRGPGPHVRGCFALDLLLGKR
jgi:hypothetical protein